MSLIPARWRRGNGHETPVEAAVSPEQAPGDQPGRLEAPQGVETWIGLTPSGGKFAFDHAWQAENRAALHKGSVVYRAIVEPMEETG